MEQIATRQLRAYLFVETSKYKPEKEYASGISVFTTGSMRWHSGAPTYLGWLPSQVLEIPDGEISGPAKNYHSMEFQSLPSVQQSSDWWD